MNSPNRHNILSWGKLITFKTVLAAGAAGFFADIEAFASPSSIPARTILTKPIGQPTWSPIGFQLFTAPIGTAASGYAEFGATQIAILPPPNHLVCSESGSSCLSLGGPGPGSSHTGYATEMSSGVAGLGLRKGPVFRLSDFSNGNGVFCTWMLVPSPGTTGASPDFASGPVIANSLCPIHVSGVTYREAQVADPYLGTFDIPALDPQLCCPFFNLDGHSHIPIFFAENMDFMPPGTNPVGSWSFRVTITDNTGNGWEITARFTVLAGAAATPGA